MAVDQALGGHRDMAHASVRSAITKKMHRKHFTVSDGLSL
jgi:hypothetical protein